jgi:hypothetical protein
VLPITLPGIVTGIAFAAAINFGGQAFGAVQPVQDHRRACDVLRRRGQQQHRAVINGAAGAETSRRSPPHEGPTLGHLQPHTEFEASPG